MSVIFPNPLSMNDAVKQADSWVDEASDLIATYRTIARERDAWSARAADATGPYRWSCINMQSICSDAAASIRDAIEQVRDDALSSLYLTAHHVPEALQEAADDFNDRLSDDCISVVRAIEQENG